MSNIDVSSEGYNKLSDDQKILISSIELKAKELGDLLTPSHLNLLARQALAEFVRQAIISVYKVNKDDKTDF